MAIDPVCGMEVDERTAKFKAEYQGARARKIMTKVFISHSKRYSVSR